MPEAAAIGRSAVQFAPAARSTRIRWPSFGSSSFATTTRDDVGIAAGGGGDDEADRLVRPVLRVRGAQASAGAARAAAGAGDGMA
jgi:hypothetical protein